MSALCLGTVTLFNLSWETAHQVTQICHHSVIHEWPQKHLQVLIWGEVSPNRQVCQSRLQEWWGPTVNNLWYIPSMNVIHKWNGLKLHASTWRLLKPNAERFKSTRGYETSSTNSNNYKLFLPNVHRNDTCREGRKRGQRSLDCSCTILFLYVDGYFIWLVCNGGLISLRTYPLELFLVLKYTCSKVHTHFTAFIVWKEMSAWNDSTYYLGQWCKPFNSMIDYNNYKDLFAQKGRRPAQERDEKERDKGSNFHF